MHTVQQQQPSPSPPSQRLTWVHYSHRYSYIRNNINLIKDAVNINHYDDEEENKFLAASTIKQGSLMAIHDRNTILSGVIGINYSFNTMLILGKKINQEGGEGEGKNNSDGAEEKKDEDEDNNSNITIIFKTYCLECKELLNINSIVPHTLKFGDVESIIHLLEKSCNKCSLVSSNKYLKWNFNGANDKLYFKSFTEVRQLINLKKSLFDICLLDLEKRKDKYKQLCENYVKQSNEVYDKSLIYQAIKNLAKEEGYNPLWINDIALNLFNVIAVNTKKKILMTLNVLEPYRIRFDYYFLKCGHRLIGKDMIVDNKNFKMDYVMIRENLDTLDCRQCYSYLFKPKNILLVVCGFIIAYAVLCY